MTGAPGTTTRARWRSWTRYTCCLALICSTGSGGAPVSGAGEGEVVSKKVGEEERGAQG